MFTLFPFFWLLIQAFVSSSPGIVPEAVTVSVPVADGIVFTSADDGSTWQNLDSGLPAELMVFSFLASEDELYIGAPEGLYRSAALGPIHEWKKEHFLLKEVTGIFPGKIGPYAISHGVYQYQPATGQWKAMFKTLPDKTVYRLLESTSGVLFAGCESGLYRSADQGKSWEQANISGWISRIEEAEGVMIVSGNHGLWRSTDEGSQWKKVQINVGSPFHLRQLSDEFVAFFDGQEIAGTRLPNQVFMSSDQGVSWQPMSPSPSEYLSSIYELVRAGRYLFACSNAGIFRSDDNGATWTPVLSPPADKGGFFKLVVDGQILYSLFINGC